MLAVCFLLLDIHLGTEYVLIRCYKAGDILQMPEYHLFQYDRTNEMKTSALIYHSKSSLNKHYATCRQCNSSYLCKLSAGTVPSLKRKADNRE